MKNNILSQDVRVASNVERLGAFGIERHPYFQKMEEKGVIEKPVSQDVHLASVEDNLIDFGRTRHWFFQKMDEKGVLEKPLIKGNWRYQLYDDSITLPSHAQKKLDGVIEARFPIMQFVYGYEEVTPDIKTQPKPHIPKPQIHISDHTVKTVATAALVLTAGAAMVVGYAFLLALSGIDPQLIAVLDTGNDESELPWILLDSWEK